MKLIGVDPGYVRLGFAILESRGNDLQLISSGCIETESAAELPQRLLAIRERLVGILSEHEPETLAIERQMFVSNRTTGLDVAKAIGVILLCCAEKGIPVFEYTPTEVKMTITGSGRADKAQIEFMVLQLLKLRTKPKLDDETDAMAVAICHAHSARIKALQRVD